MKKIFTTLSILSVAVIAMMFFQSCKKDLPTYLAIQPYAFTSLDENGGDWKPVYLSGGDAVSIPDPTDVNSAEYQQELADLKTTMSAATSDQKEAVQYWGTNSVVRWNEITRELVSKYNLPATPNEDGTYSSANSADPGTYPYFPFSQPPYSCRAYAYLSVATYDALVAVWYQKYKYNRPAPYKVDPSITPLLPKSDLPGYVSEDAAIAAASKVILNFLFPLEVDYIAGKADEAENSRLWAGMNVQSDITAGDSLGRAVANIVLARAKGDGMKFAQVTKPVSDSLENAAQALWGYHWENLEVPQRPVGITPFFGHVKLWFVPSVLDVRPPSPPAPGSPEFNTAVDELKGYMNNLTKDQEDIAFFWSDGLGTYTPTGHWDKIATDYIVQNQLNPLRTARVYAYLNSAMMDAGVCCWDAKYYFHYPRPSGADPEIKTILGIPNFPSYTSGHSTFSGAASAVLAYMFPEGTTQFQDFAKQASESRIYSRIHFRFDCEAGLDAGISIGGYAVAKAQADGAD